MDAAPVKILLVDDRPANLVALESALADPGYQLVKAGSGAEALRFLLSDECALILLDVNMPELDGYETARLVRQNPRTRTSPSSSSPPTARTSGGSRPATRAARWITSSSRSRPTSSAPRWRPSWSSTAPTGS